MSDFFTLAVADKPSDAKNDINLLIFIKEIFTLAGHGYCSDEVDTTLHLWEGRIVGRRTQRTLILQGGVTMNVTRSLSTGIVACAALAGIAGAQAHTLLLTNFVGPDGAYHQGVDVTTPPYGGQAGGFVGTWDGSPIQVWCNELTQTFNFGTAYTDYSLGTPANEGLLSALFQEAYAMSTTSAMNSAAFQLAIWEILYDGDLSLYSGSFHTNRVANATDLLAESWLAGLGGFADKGDIILYSSGDHQDFIGRAPSSNLPEPGPLALIGMGLFAMLVSHRRREGARG